MMVNEDRKGTDLPKIPMVGDMNEENGGSITPTREKYTIPPTPDLPPREKSSSYRDDEVSHDTTKSSIWQLFAEESMKGQENEEKDYRGWWKRVSEFIRMESMEETAKEILGKFRRIFGSQELESLMNRSYYKNAGSSEWEGKEKHKIRSRAIGWLESKGKMSLENNALVGVKRGNFFEYWARMDIFHGGESSSAEQVVLKLVKAMACFKKGEGESVSEMLARMQKLITSFENYTITFDHRAKCAALNAALYECGPNVWDMLWKRVVNGRDVQGLIFIDLFVEINEEFQKDPGRYNAMATNEIQVKQDMVRVERAVEKLTKELIQVIKV